MSEPGGFDLQAINAVNASAAFNRAMGFEVIAAGKGEVTIRMDWRDDLTQYSGHLHAGLIAALLDTACGFAAATLVGAVTASHFSMNCLRPAVGRYFVASGTTLRAGRRQVFARAELFAADERDDLTRVATGETVLVPTGEPRKADGS
ncbi:PaaI family thioesterase [Bradyrhizobium sp. KB893862 SZCCT0404]|uniref:PaaI family thioesterase n=1 Tax=Bradyrhizobium sp. KB893862 SZCCT0404 TaxID=2807672 RepID=UPI001BA5B317|nr:PaaI family thioesterase [Bradyrhizobium sp. KB893862 SZCCT0404]MBR1176576.1 PaaI family thioesterase [Bradyrhizobium sp. KB893862 SZCCT0404]